MEELLILLFQFLIEVCGSMLVELPWELFGPAGGSRVGNGRFEVGVCSLIVGGLIGGVSLLVFPHSLIGSGVLRMVNLVVAPASSASFAWLLSGRPGTRRQADDRRFNAVCSFLFVFAFTVIRFAFGNHGG